MNEEIEDFEEEEIEIDDMDKSIEELISEWENDHKTWLKEGERGVKNLHLLCEHLGYKEDPFKYGSPIEKFLADNSGAIEAIHEWIMQQDRAAYSWKEELITHLSAKNDED